MSKASFALLLSVAITWLPAAGPSIRWLSPSGPSIRWLPPSGGSAQSTKKPPEAVPVTLRFHHLHYRVPDPGDALGDAAQRLGGTRTILQGVGVGIRVGSQYVLFERESAAAPEGRRVAPADAYADAVRWMSAHGVAAQPTTLAKVDLAADLPSATLDHLAFAADDLRAAVAALRDTPASVAEDAVRFRLPSGLVVEIVRDTDLPDKYWCP